MKVYLAAAWSRRAEIEEVAVRLRQLGVEVTSNWLTEEKAQQTGAREKFLRDRAYLDLRDVDEADAIVRFTDDLQGSTLAPTHLISGARHFEFGYAKAKGKTLYVVGGKQNVFDRLDGIVHLKDVDELCQVLSQEGVMSNEVVAPTTKALGSNPKDVLGAKKPSASKIPAVAIAWESLAMMDGAGKYDPYNWRANKVIASIYVDACKRHLDLWFEGQRTASDSGCHHLGHARACLGILLDAEATGNLKDDRPVTEGSTEAYVAVMKEIESLIPAMLERHQKFHAEKAAKSAEKPKG